MKKVSVTATMFGLLWSGVSFASGDEAYKVTDMAKVSTMALEELKSLRPDIEDSIYRASFSFGDHNTIVTFFSRSEDGTTERISMGCHAHDGVEECHLRS